MKPEDWDTVSKDYFSEIESPFAIDVINPLYEHIKTAKGKSAIDLGCGLGQLIPHIKEKYENITCIDFSQEMLKKAEKKHSDKKIEFHKADMKDLSQFYNKFDTAFAINSILEPSVNSIQTILSEIYKVIRQKGTFISIFPSIESEILRAAITFDNEYSILNSEKESIKNTHITIGSKDYDLLFGFFNNDGKQKHFYKIQLEYRLKKAGFKNIIFDKVLYPWKTCVDKSLRNCNVDMQLFDWFVRAEKA